MNPFLRSEWLMGKEAIDRLQKSKVAVFGVGGVGSYVVEGLTRSGIGSLVLVDCADIHITNLNRQIHATMKTIGRPKVDVMMERILDINPYAQVTIHREFYIPGESDDLIDNSIDYIVDAIDTVTGKIGLVVLAKEKDIPIISSMGAGNKLDPTRFEVADIYSTSVCPLAKVMRKELRKRNIGSLKVVYSTEKPIKPMSDSQAGNISTADGRSSIKQLPGSVPFVPSVAGLIIAAEVVKDLTSL